MANTAYEAGPTVEPLLRPQEAATVLACSRRTLERLVDSGELHPVRIGGLVRFEPSELRGLIERKATR